MLHRYLITYMSAYISGFPQFYISRRSISGSTRTNAGTNCGLREVLLNSTSNLTMLLHFNNNNSVIIMLLCRCCMV